jgi:ubiquinone/menaquinone biosynthesis C-methylase UbiE
VTANLYDPLVELYEQQYVSYRDDLAFYRDLARDYGSPILELGAGTGRVTRALAASGHEVVAVEPSGKMLARAKQKLEAENLHERVTLLQETAQNLNLDRHFPLVIAPFNMLMHLYTLADQDAALSKIRQHLEPHGRFACDLYNPHFGQLDVLRREPYWTNMAENSELFVLQHHNADTQVLESHYYLDTVDASGTLTRQVFSLTQRYYHRFELERALQVAGFTHITCYGDFDKQRYSTKAPHLIALAH